MKILVVTIFALFAFSQCPSPNTSSQKELELKEKELALKEKEMEMKDKSKDDASEEGVTEEEKTEKKASSADNDEKEKSEKSAKSDDKSSSGGTTAIKFDKGKSSKTLSVSLKKGQSKRYTLDVGKGQVINIEALTDGSTINLVNGKRGVDNWEDGDYGLSILTGRKGIFIVEIANKFDEDLTIPMKVTITNNPDDYEGGIQ